MTKVYKYTVYIEDMDELGHTNWEIEIEENISNGGTCAYAEACFEDETQSYDYFNEELECMSFQEIFEKFS